MWKIETGIVVNGIYRDALYMETEFNGWYIQELYIDYGSCISRVKINDISFKEEGIKESYTEFINRVIKEHND